MEKFEFVVIGKIKSPFKEKFGTPRQPGLTPDINGFIQINKNYSNIDAFYDLEGFSHIWIIFVFHQEKTLKQQWSPKVRPPRLGGNKKVSVFATRSPNRPNPIGLSLVKLEKIRMNKQCIELEISGHDFIEGTPVLDIKPYHAEVESLVNVQSGWISENPFLQNLDVIFNENVLEKIDSNLQREIIDYLKLDPRPSFHSEVKVYKNKFRDYDISWTIEDDKVIVNSLKMIK